MCKFRNVSFSKSDSLGTEGSLEDRLMKSCVVANGQAEEWFSLGFDPGSVRLLGLLSILYVCALWFFSWGEDPQRTSCS